MKPIIKIDNVCKTYLMGEVEVNALCGVDVEIYPGEFVAIMGASGSGKSTMMNMVGCLDVPTEGRVFLEDRDISRLAESDLAQIRGRTIGFIFQTFNLMPGLTALENVALPMIFQDVPFDERMERAWKLLELVELGHRMNHKPAELSGGQQQRVAIARALVNDPKLILADEPTGNLDSKTGRDVMGILARLNKDEGKTIVMVTHEADIAKYAERTIHLRDGRVIDDGANGARK
ncbi:MAG: macrolide ABC transporter ATP-binding protein [Candidatus Altiarchaeales archaeon IMC4]|nr:MAG: macrolide ABC transporter ATP-binding protein [Candidatus Altiarchaeales archaeon IMC4]